MLDQVNSNYYKIIHIYKYFRHKYILNNIFGFYLFNSSIIKIKKIMYSVEDDQSSSYFPEESSNDQKPLTESYLNSIDECYELIGKINKLILTFKEKNNKTELPFRHIRDEVNPGINLKKQIELTEWKDSVSFNQELNKYFQNFDCRIIQSSSNKDSSVPSSSKFQTNNIQNINAIHFFSKNMPNLSTLLERVNSELKVQEFYYEEDIRKEDEIRDASRLKIEENEKLIEIFELFIKEINKRINSLSDTNSLEETKHIKDKCSQEYYNFENNTLKKITNLDRKEKLDKKTINEYIKDSDNNLTKLNEKIKNLTKNPYSNQLGQKVLNIFNMNILLAKQNNDLTKFVLNELLNPVYQETFNNVSLISFLQRNNFKETKTKIQNIKQEFDDASAQNRNKDISNECLDSDEDYN